MAKVRSFTHHVPGLDGTRVRKSVAIYYSPKKEYFYINLPEHLDVSLSMRCESSYGGARAERVPERDGVLTGGTASEVETAFIRLCFRYRESLKKARKVIVYTLRWCKAEDKEQNGLPFDDSTGLIVQWEKGWEIKLGNEQSKFFNFDPTDPENAWLCTGRAMRMVGRDGVDDDGHVVDWSQEREDFFISLVNSVESMIKRARSFLDKPKKLMIAIDSGSGLRMLGMDKKKTGGK